MGPFLNGFAHELAKLAQDGFKVQLDVGKAFEKAKKAPSSRDIEMKNDLETIREKSKRVGRNYLRSAVIGAATLPLAHLGGKALTRAVHNRQVLREVAKAPNRIAKREASKAMLKGPLIGSSARVKPGVEPVMTTSEMAGGMARGGLTGSVLQMIQDRFQPEKNH